MRAGIVAIPVLEKERVAIEEAEIVRMLPCSEQILGEREPLQLDDPAVILAARLSPRRVRGKDDVVVPVQRVPVFEKSLGSSEVPSPWVGGQALRPVADGGASGRLYRSSSTG